MKEIEINESSLLYKIASFGNPHRSVSNICKLTRALAAGTFFLALATGASVWLVMSFGEAFAWIAAGIVHGFVEVEPLAVLAVALTIVASGVVAIVVTKVLVINPINERRRESGVPTPVVVEIYRAWHDKVCFKVKVKHND